MGERKRARGLDDSRPKCVIARKVRDMLELDADDVECLWAIVRNATVRDRLVRARGEHLESAGLIEITDGSPILTTGRRDVLVILATKMVNALHANTAKAN